MKKIKNSSNNTKYLKKRLAYLEEIQRHTQDTLEMAMSFGNLGISINKLDDPLPILLEAGLKGKRIIKYKSTAFYLIDEKDSDFFLFNFEPEDYREFLNNEIQVFVNDGTFSRAIRENRSIITYASNTNEQILLHVMSTNSRVRGMFVGVLEQDAKDIPEYALQLFSIIMIQCANTLESFELYRKIKDINIKLIQAGKFKSEFLAKISHDIKGPLSNPLILTELLLENNEKNLTEDQIDSIKTIHKICIDLIDLTEDILDLSKMEAGKLNICFGIVSISDLIRDLKSQFDPISKRKKLEFNIFLTDNLTKKIISDRKRLYQILKNLIFNALKFTEKGSVALDIYNPTEDIKFLQNLTYNNSIAFSITDTGIGISKEKQLSIFEAFQQADDSINKNYGGTGLGLTIAKELSRLLKGEIHLKSIKGKGSIFTLYLPIGDLSVEEKIIEEKNLIEDKQEMPQNIEVKGKKVLFVDDDELNLSITSSVLEQAGFSVFTAENGSKAIDALEKEKDINLLVIDMTMPVMDGYEAIKIIRSKDIFKNMPIIALTGRTLEEDKEKCIEAGADSYLAKPVDLGKLIALINSFLYPP